jgi:hypothetical protein
MEQPVWPERPDMDKIMAVAGGYLNSRMLFTANDIGLFAALGGAGATVSELAERCGVPQRRVRIVADVLATCGVLERDGDRYRNTAEAEVFLSGRGPVDMKPILRYWDIVSYRRAESSTEAVRHGRGATGSLDARQQEAYQGSVAFSTAPSADALPEVFDFAGKNRVLDIGGGVGTMLLPLLGRWRHLSATLVDLPEVVELARRRLDAGPAADRVATVAADVLVDPLPRGHDVIMVAHLMHLFQPEENRALLGRLRRVAGPDTTLLMVDWWRHWEGLPPPAAVYGAMEFMLISGGDTYTPDEAGQWLDATGWRATGFRPVAGETSMIVAERVDPAG